MNEDHIHHFHAQEPRPWFLPICRPSQSHPEIERPNSMVLRGNSRKNRASTGCAPPVMWTLVYKPHEYYNYLVGGLFSFLFPYMGMIIPTDFHIFQSGWNHQPVIRSTINHGIQPLIAQLNALEQGPHPFRSLHQPPLGKAGRIAGKNVDFSLTWLYLQMLRSFWDIDSFRSGWTSSIFSDPSGSGVASGSRARASVNPCVSFHSWMSSGSSSGTGSRL